MTNSFAPPTGGAVGAENFLTDGVRAVLRVTRCHNCAGMWFPPRDQCSTCASRDVTEELTSSSGIAYASSVVRIGPPRFQAPYVLAYVDDGVRVLACTQPRRGRRTPARTAPRILAGRCVRRLTRRRYPTSRSAPR